jgi:ankyrin repeat protein
MREIIIKDPSRLFGQLKPGDQDIIGWTPLHYYARCGLVEPCELFLKENQRFVNSQDKYGDTPLSDAAYWGNRGIAALLLENGADVNACNSKGQTPVCRAVMKNYLKMVKLLVKVGKADVNKVLDRHGNTLAHVIAYRSRAADGTVQIMNYLVKHGLDLRRRNKYGDTPFMRACRIYNSYLVPELRKILMKTPSGNGPDEENCWLSFQLWQNEGEIDNLIERGLITPFMKDNIGWTIFHYFARHGMVSQCRMLLGQLPFYPALELIRSTDQYGDSPLSDAAYWGHTAMVKFLLDYGADPDVFNAQGQSPALRAVLGGHPETAKLLIRSCNVNMSLDEHGNTLLHELAYQESQHIPEIMKLAKEKGFPEQRNKYGDTAMSRAVRILNLPVIECLQVHDKLAEIPADGDQVPAGLDHRPDHRPRNTYRMENPRQGDRKTSNGDMTYTQITNGSQMAVGPHAQSTVTINVTNNYLIEVPI